MKSKFCTVQCVYFKSLSTRAHNGNHRHDLPTTRRFTIVLNTHSKTWKVSQNYRPVLPALDLVSEAELKSLIAKAHYILVNCIPISWLYYQLSLLEGICEFKSPTLYIRRLQSESIITIFRNVTSYRFEFLWISTIASSSTFTGAVGLCVI